MNLWMKRAIGVAVLGGGLLALSAGAASAQEISADVTARLGRSTSAEVRVCADSRVLSRLLGCTDRAGGTVQAGRASDGSGAIRARVRVPGAADADVSIGTRRGRPSTTASGQASATRRARAAAAADTSPSADATASLTRPGPDGCSRSAHSAWPGWACSGRAHSPWSATPPPAASCRSAS